MRKHNIGISFRGEYLLKSDKRLWTPSPFYTYDKNNNLIDIRDTPPSENTNDWFAPKGYKYNDFGDLEKESNETVD